MHFHTSVPLHGILAAWNTVPSSLLHELLRMLEGLPDPTVPTVHPHYLVCAAPPELFRLLN